MSKDKKEAIPEVKLVGGEKESEDKDTVPFAFKDRFGIEDVGDVFEFIQKIAFPDMPLEMVAILSSKEIGMAMRLYDAIYMRMTWEFRYNRKFDIKNPKTYITQLAEYIGLLIEYLRLSVSKEGKAREQFMEITLGGVAKQEVKYGLFGRKKG